MKAILDVTKKDSSDYRRFERMLKSKYNKLIYLCDIGMYDKDKLDDYKKSLISIFGNNYMEPREILLLTEYDGININIISFNLFKGLMKKYKTSTLKEIDSMLLSGDRVILLDFLNDGYKSPALLTNFNCKYMYSRHIMNMSNLILFADSQARSRRINVSKDTHETFDYSDFEIEKGRQNIATIHKIANLKKERILCKAIHYRDNVFYDLAPTNVQSGYVVCGITYTHCKDMITSIFDCTKDTVCGFVTNYNRFIEPDEALVIARQAKQIRLKDTIEDILPSYDLN